MDSIPITQEGYENLLREHDYLTKVELPAIINKVAEARSLGDLRENAEYHAAREHQSLLQTKINTIRDRLSRCKIVKIGVRNSSTIIFGSHVKIMDVEDSSTEEYTLVGEAETNPGKGKISTTSPIGKALLGRSAGETVEVQTPGGKIRLKIIAFE
ncbi:MAG: transcription elongation factor GreA [Chitinivibrionales bacterium]|nr:transcription elongation factor GreA [Chitinivibrionales bacterium]